MLHRTVPEASGKLVKASNGGQQLEPSDVPQPHAHIPRMENSAGWESSDIKDALPGEALSCVWSNAGCGYRQPQLTGI